MKKALSLTALAWILGNIGVVVFGYKSPLVTMKSCDKFAVLASSTITNTGTSHLNGDLGLYPGASGTGLATIALNGDSYIADNAGVASQAQSDLAAALTQSNGRVADSIIASVIGNNQTITPGVYKTADDLTITGNLTLNAMFRANASWVFNIDSALTVMGSARVFIINKHASDADQTNIWWNCGSAATINALAHVIGTVMGNAAITCGAGAVTGPLLSHGAAVTLNTNGVTSINYVAPTAAPTQSPSLAPSITPSVTPTLNPTWMPTIAPTPMPSTSFTPTAHPSNATAGFSAPELVVMGTVKNFAIIAYTTITNSGATTLNGGLVLFPGSAITGQDGITLTAGEIYVSDAAGVANKAQTDLTAAILDAWSRHTDVTLPDHIGNNQTLKSGVYETPSTLNIAGNLTLDAQFRTDAAWIFNIHTALTVEAKAIIKIINQSPFASGHDHVWWNCGSAATIKADAVIVGTVMADAGITSNLNTITGSLCSSGADVTIASVQASSYLYAPPTAMPTDAPSAVPSTAPSKVPTVIPTIVPTRTPTVVPSVLPTVVPTVVPSVVPSRQPTVVPTVIPTVLPSRLPSVLPTVIPTVTPTIMPSVIPTVVPTRMPSVTPTIVPSVIPSVVPTRMPSATPSISPSAAPSTVPTVAPSGPTQAPVVGGPTIPPSTVPTVTPSKVPTVTPSKVPSTLPTIAPSTTPSVQPTVMPSAAPSVVPTVIPSVSPSMVPSAAPSTLPTTVPSVSPSFTPSATPSTTPTVTPSAAPSKVPSASPTAAPSAQPSVTPSVVPTVFLSTTPTVSPTLAPSRSPTVIPTAQPSKMPTVLPTVAPTVKARPAFVAMGSCAGFAVIGSTTVTNAELTLLNGDLALAPGSAVTGQGTITLNGKYYVSDGAGVATRAKTDLFTAIADASSRATDTLLLDAIGNNMTLTSGVYFAASTLQISGNLTLDAQFQPDAAWIFNLGSALTVDENANIMIINKAPSVANNGTDNVWWNCGSAATIGAYSHVPGVIMAQTAVIVDREAVTGALFSSTAAVNTVAVKSVTAYKYVPPTPAPTARPTQAPQAQVLPVISFTSSLGMTADVTVDGNGAVTLTKNDTRAIESAVAKSMNISADSCTVTSVRLADARRRLLSLLDILPHSALRTRSAPHHQQQHHALAVHAFVADVQTTVAMDDHPSFGYNTSAFYSQLVSSLKESAASGELQTLVQSEAAVYGSALTTVSVDSTVNTTAATVSYPIEETASNAEDGLTKGEIAAIVICSFIGLVGLLICMFMCLCRAPSNDQHKTNMDNNGQQQQQQNPAGQDKQPYHAVVTTGEPVEQKV